MGDNTPILQALDYPVMDRGMNTTLPNRSMTPNSNGPLFKLVQNMVGHDGVLASWFGVFPLTEFATNGYPTIQNNGSWFETTPNGVLNGQTVMYQFYDYPMTWNQYSALAQDQSLFGSFMGIVVTSREIFLYSAQDHNWYNATPVYTTGTVSVAAISPTIVTGVGTNWSARKIAVGQLIELESNWYSIKSVDSDTQITLNSAVTTAPVPAGSSYTIRRCFGGRNYSHGDNLLYGTVFNGDLYLAGRTLAGKSIGPAVIRVKDIYTNVQTTEYLLAPYDLTGSMSTNGSVVSDLWDIKGLQILPDGRVLLATSEIPRGAVFAKQGIVGNRLRYSSNVGNTSGSVSAQEIWGASPAGFIDVVDREGEITALGRMGPSVVTIHFHRGISLGVFSSQYDPPISIQPTNAEVGCVAPRTLAWYQGAEIFLGADGIVHAFDGTSTQELSDETVSFIHNEENEQVSFTVANTHSVVDTRKNHYRLFFCDNNFEQVATVPADYEDYTINTICWVLDLENPNQFYYETYGPHVTSAAFPAVGAEASDLGTYLPTSVGGDFGTIVLGVNTDAPSAAAADQLNGNILYGMAARDNAVGNHVWDSDAYTDRPSFVVETDDLDFGLPGVDKTLSHILIWFSAADLATSTVPTVSAYGQPMGYITASGPSTFAVATDQPVMFSFTPTASEKWRIRIERTVASNNASRGMMIHRMRVYYQTQGEVEAANPSL